MASIKIKQHDIKDCGAACLASIGNHFKVNLPIAKIRQFANTDKRGTNVLGIIEAVEKFTIDSNYTDDKTLVVVKRDGNSEDLNE